MAAKTSGSEQQVDRLLRNLLLLSRTVDYVLTDQAVKTAVEEHLSVSQVYVLRLLGTRGSYTSVQIARLLGITKAAVSQLVNSLVHRKLVVRRPATQDHRAIDLHLTPKGRAAFEAVRNRQRNLLRSTAKQGSAADAKRWNGVLEQIIEAVNSTSGVSDALAAAL